MDINEDAPVITRDEIVIRAPIETIWKYEPEVLWKDLSAHLVFGTATAAAFALLAHDR